MRDVWSVLYKKCSPVDLLNISLASKGARSMVSTAMPHGLNVVCLQNMWSAQKMLARHVLGVNNDRQKALLENSWVCRDTHAYAFCSKCWAWLRHVYYEVDIDHKELYVDVDRMVEVNKRELTCNGLCVGCREEHAFAFLTDTVEVAI